VQLIEDKIDAQRGDSVNHLRMMKEYRNTFYSINRKDDKTEEDLRNGGICEVGTALLGCVLK
jgi:hypothetical protein